MNLFTFIHQLFSPGLSISSDFIHASVSDVFYHLKESELIDYNYSTGIENTEKKAHPLILTKISWFIISHLNSYLDKPIKKQILNRIIHQSASIDYFSTIPFNVSLKVSTKIWAIQPHKKGTKIIIRFDYFNGTELIATEYSGGLLFKVKCKGKLQSAGKYPETKKMDSEQYLFETTLPISKNSPYLYAQKTAIDAAIHTNPGFAKSIGLKDVLVQGTYTFALALNAINTYYNPGSKKRIKEVNVKFIGKVYPTSKITLRLIKCEGLTVYFYCYDSEYLPVLAGSVYFEEDLLSPENTV